MRRCILWLLVLLAFIVVGGRRSLADEGSETSRFVVAGYLPEYRLTDVPANRSLSRGTLSNGTPAHGESAHGTLAVTDLIFFGLRVPKDGQSIGGSLDTTQLQRLQSLPRRKDARLLVCVGGWNRSDGFAEVAKDKASRQKFVSELFQFCDTHGFTGVDYDWEHPQGTAEIEAYANLIVQTRERFHRRGWIVTVAQAPWQDLGTDVYGAVDRVHLMAYDHDFPQATFDKALADVDRLIGWECPAEKITLGIPFYGRNADRVARTYAELIQSSETVAEDDLRDGFALNDRETVIRKVRLAKRRGLAGVMVWELGQDANDPGQSLMSAIVEEAAK